MWYNLLHILYINFLLHMTHTISTKYSLGLKSFHKPSQQWSMYWNCLVSKIEERRCLKNSTSLKVTPRLGIRLAQLNMSNINNWIIGCMGFSRPADDALGRGLYLQARQWFKLGNDTTQNSSSYAKRGIRKKRMVAKRTEGKIFWFSNKECWELGLRF